MQSEQQWSTSAPEEEDVRPWYYQRRSWRVALEKEEVTREKLLEMTISVMQREGLERLGMFDMRMGMELMKQCSGDSSEPADIGPGRESRHGDAEQQPVPDGADEADGNLNNAYPGSCTSRSEAGLHFGETNTSKKSCRGSGQDADDSETKNEGDTGGTGAGEQRDRNREEKGGTSCRIGIGRGDAAGAPETAHEFPLGERSGQCCEDRRRCESCAEAGDDSKNARVAKRLRESN